MKNKSFIIKINTYPFNVMFSLGQKQKELNKALKKQKVKCGEECTKVKDCAGYYIPFSNGMSLIRLKNYPKTNLDFAILQHEILHCTFDILRQVGVKLSNKSEEAFTYLHEYITEQVLNELEWKK